MLEQWYGIMPNKILFSKRLSDKEKLLYVMISSLSAEKWYCRANNNYFSDRLWITKQNVSKRINSLYEKWFITIDIDKDQWNKRFISITENNNTYYWNQEEGIIENNNTPIIENNKHNSIIYNNIKEVKEKYFEKFREKYPIKKNKQNAKKKFIKLVMKEWSANAIMKWLENYIKEYETKKARWEFVAEYAHATTWLNGMRWRDEYDIKEKTMDELVKDYDDMKNSDKSRVTYKTFKEQYGEEKALQIRRARQEMVTDRALLS